MTKINKLRGANMDIDLINSQKVAWEQDHCPWNAADGTPIHKCAVKNTSICDYFCGVEFPDHLLCSYPHKK